MGGDLSLYYSPVDFVVKPGQMVENIEKSIVPHDIKGLTRAPIGHFETINIAVYRRIQTATGSAAGSDIYAGMEPAFAEISKSGREVNVLAERPAGGIGESD